MSFSSVISEYYMDVNLITYNKYEHCKTQEKLLCCYTISGHSI